MSYINTIYVTVPVHIHATSEELAAQAEAAALLAIGSDSGAFVLMPRGKSDYCEARADFAGAQIAPPQPGAAQ